MGCWRRLKHFNDLGSFVCILIVHSCGIVQCNAIMNLQCLSSSSSSYKRTPQPYLSVLFTPTSNTTPFPSSKISPNPKLKASIKSPRCISTQIFQYPQTFAHFSPSRPSRWNPTLPLDSQPDPRMGTFPLSLPDRACRDQRTRRFCYKQLQRLQITYGNMDSIVSCNANGCV